MKQISIKQRQQTNSITKLVHTYTRARAHIQQHHARPEDITTKAITATETTTTRTTTYITKFAGKEYESNNNRATKKKERKKIAENIIKQQHVEIFPAFTQFPQSVFVYFSKMIEPTCSE